MDISLNEIKLLSSKDMTRIERRRESNRNAMRRSHPPKNPVEQSRFHRGRRWEIYALDNLPGSIDVNRCVGNAPFDILWEDMAIDVKSFVKHPVRDQWSFTSSGKGKCDFFLCLCVNRDGSLLKSYLIPYSLFNSGISIGNVSKYDKYLFRFPTS